MLEGYVLTATNINLNCLTINFFKKEISIKDNIQLMKSRLRKKNQKKTSVNGTYLNDLADSYKFID